MLEMLQHILRFIITMKHVIYGTILSAARRSGGVLQAPPAVGERCKLPQQWGSAVSSPSGLLSVVCCHVSKCSSSGNRIWCILA